MKTQSEIEKMTEKEKVQYALELQKEISRLQKLDVKKEVRNLSNIERIRAEQVVELNKARRMPGFTETPEG